MLGPSPRADAVCRHISTEREKVEVRTSTVALRRIRLFWSGTLIQDWGEASALPLRGKQK